METLVDQLGAVIFSEGEPSPDPARSAKPEHDANQYILRRISDSRPVLISRSALAGRDHDVLQDETGASIEVRKVLGMEVRSPVNALRSEAVSFSFYELRPERFAPFMPGRGRVTFMHVGGRIPQAAVYFVTGGYEIIEKPARNPLLREVQATFPVDLEKYDAKRQRIAEDLGIRIVPYAAAA